ncbi:unnamed protein product, partial [Discosporangium mesarthrocarpum]
MFFFSVPSPRKVAWRVSAARSLWTWSDLGRGLRERRPGWLHASVAGWRWAATAVAMGGGCLRML